MITAMETKTLRHAMLFDFQFSEFVRFRVGCQTQPYFRSTLVLVVFGIMYANLIFGPNQTNLIHTVASPFLKSG